MGACYYCVWKHKRILKLLLQDLGQPLPAGSSKTHISGYGTET